MTRCSAMSAFVHVTVSPTSVCSTAGDMQKRESCTLVPVPSVVAGWWQPPPAPAGGATTTPTADTLAAATSTRRRMPLLHLRSANGSRQRDGVVARERRLEPVGDLADVPQQRVAGRSRG